MALFVPSDIRIMVFINEITKINQHYSEDCLANQIGFKLKEKY